MRVIVGEEKCDPRLRVPSGGGRKAWRPRGGAVAGFSRYGGGGPLPFALGEISGKDSGPECLFSCLRGDGCCKMVWPHKSWSTHRMFIKLSQVPFVV